MEEENIEQEYEKLNEAIKIFSEILKSVETKVKEAYEKSCKGDWSCLDDIEPLKWMGAYYTEFALRESLLRNLVAREDVTEKEET